jgi:alkylation response protein AidB-like acyl-CoA dehydrogenase
VTAPQATDHHLDVLSALAPLVEAEAPASERGRALTQPLVEALLRHGLFRLWLPRTFGGLERSLPGTLAVFEAAAALDGSFGWALNIGTGGGLFAAHMERSFAHEVFEPRAAVIAGSGTPSGAAVEVPGGYRVTGHWRYASGSQYATWFTASCALYDDAGPKRGAEGQQLIRAMSFPRAAVHVHDTWDTLGMRATSSHDFSVEGVFVPAARSFDVFGEPSEHGPLYRFPFLGIAELSFAAAALGIAAHGIEAFERFAAGKRIHYSGGLLADAPLVRQRVGEATSALAGAREHFYAAAAGAWARVSAGEPEPPGEPASLTRAAAEAAQTSSRALDSVFALAGMSPLFHDSTFGRCWRDVRTLAQHALLSPLRLEADEGPVSDSTGPDRPAE